MTSLSFLDPLPQCNSPRTESGNGGQIVAKKIRLIFEIEA